MRLKLHKNMQASGAAVVAEFLDNQMLEQQYRDRYPELNNLWIQYKTLLALLQDGPRDDNM
jgi:hypothetical protein